MKRSTLLVSLGAAFAAPTLPRRAWADPGTLRVGMTGDYRPYSTIGADGAWSGFDVDVATALAKARGVELTIVKTTWPTMTADLLATAFDIAMGGVSRDPGRAAAGSLSMPYMADGKVALIRAADRDRWKTLADFDVPAVRVAVNPGGTNALFVRDRLSHAHVDIMPTNLSIPGLVSTGTADVMFTDGVEAAIAARADPKLIVLNANAPYTHVDKVYFLRKDAAALLAFVDDRLVAWEHDGQLPAWREHWIGSNANDPAKAA